MEFELDESSKIGHGSYGSIYGVGSKVIKYLKISDNGIQGLNELDILSRFNHQYLVGIEKYWVGKFQSYDGLFLIMDRAISDLGEFIHKNHVIDMRTRVRFMYEIASAINFLNISGVLHLDIKPQNILVFLDTNGVPYTRLADFGLSATYVDGESISKSRLGYTYGFRPPEFTYYSDRGSKGEVWALGIVYIYILIGSIYTFTDNETYSNKIKDFYTNVYPFLFLPEVVSQITDDDDVHDLLIRMLDPDPEHRIDMRTVLHHQLFKKNGYTFDIPGLIKSIPPTSNYFGSHQIILTISWIYNISSYYSVTTETVYLTMDLFHRCFSLIVPQLESMLNRSSGTYANIDLLTYGSVCLLIASKITEPKHIDIVSLASLFEGQDEKVESNDFRLVELNMVNSLGGSIYVPNFFTYAYSKQSLIDTFEYLDNCFIYNSLDKKEIVNMISSSETSDQRENRMSKLLPFDKFFAETKYCRDLDMYGSSFHEYRFNVLPKTHDIIK